MLCARENVEESIISLLRKKNSGGKKIRADLEKMGILVSSQSVYKALKKLIGEEVVLKNGTIYGLNYVWLKRLNQFSSPSKGKSKEFLLFKPGDLLEGEQDTYYFNNLNRAGAFWMHIHQILLDDLKPNQTVVLYSTNEWTSIIRKSADSEWAKTAIENSNLTLFAIGQDNLQNRDYKSKHSKGNLQINVGKTYNFPTGYYLNIFNDYIVELILSKEVDNKITELFKKHTDKIMLYQELVDAGVYNCKIKLSVKRNQKKAQKLFKRISKDFYVPRI